MTEALRVVVSAAVEGPVDEAVLRRLVIVGVVYGKGGKSALKRNVPAYHHAARLAPWIVLADFDSDYDCAPPLRADGGRKSPWSMRTACADAANEYAS